MSTLICYDGSPSAKEALGVARATLSGPMTLLHVWSPPAAYLADTFSDPDRLGGPSLHELEQLAVGRAREIVYEGQRLARELGLAVHPRLERNDSTV